MTCATFPAAQALAPALRGGRRGRAEFHPSAVEVCGTAARTSDRPQLGRRARMTTQRMRRLTCVALGALRRGIWSDPNSGKHVARKCVPKSARKARLSTKIGTMGTRTLPRRNMRAQNESGTLRQKTQAAFTCCPKWSGPPG